MRQVRFNRLTKISCQRLAVKVGRAPYVSDSWRIGSLKPIFARDLRNAPRLGRGWTGAGTLVIAAAFGIFISGAALAAPVPESFADLAEQLSPAVVNVSTAREIKRSSAGGQGRGIPMPDFPPGSPFEEFFKEFMDPENGPSRPRRVQSLGSGFVIDPKGIIVTNNHVIEGADEIDVKFQDGTVLKAEVLGRDPKTDIAILKVEPEADLPFVELGDSNTKRVGDWVMAIGNPFGLGGTVTAGIISARNRQISNGPYDDFLQTDASINRGNSGGPLFGMDGKVIGINTAIYSPSGGSVGIGFAVPTSVALPVIKQLSEFGETRRGWLGVRIQTVTPEIAESLDMARPRGALVASVNDDGPAKEAGIEPGDVVLRFDGREVRKMRDLPRMVAETNIEKSVMVEVLRKGRRMPIRVQVGRLEEGEIMASAEEEVPVEAPSSAVALGLDLAELTPGLRKQFDLADVPEEGVIVTKVDPDSDAAIRHRVRPGDVVVEVAMDKVTTPEEVIAKVEVAKKANRKSVLLLVKRRKGNLEFIALKLDEA